MAAVQPGPMMEKGSVQPTGTVVGAGHPVPSEADLKAYDGLLTSASRLTLRLVKSKAFTTFRVDVDGRRDQLTIVVNFDRDPKHVGKNLRNAEPFGAFVADVLLGDGADGRIVQTISNDGVVEYRQARVDT